VRTSNEHQSTGVIEKFQKLDFHDDALVSVSVRTPFRRGATADIAIAFRDDSNGAKKVLRFRSCGNIRYVMDFDVLADN
jgi:hypothetical protein